MDYNVRSALVTTLFVSMVLAVVLLLPDGKVQSFTERVGQQLASVVGMTAGVEANPYNLLATELTEREQVLNQREKALNDLEQSLRSEVATSYRNTLLTILFVAAVLLMLIGVNFYLDRKRNTRPKPASPSLQVRL